MESLIALPGLLQPPPSLPQEIGSGQGRAAPKLVRDPAGPIARSCNALQLLGKPGLADGRSIGRAAVALAGASAPILPFGVLRLLLIVAVDAAGVLIVQLEALLTGGRLTVLRHHGEKVGGRGGGTPRQEPMKGSWSDAQADGP